MKNIILFLIFAANYQVIKYKSFDRYVYDWFDNIKPDNGYISYTKKTVFGTKTNYFHGPYQIIAYEKYLKEVK